MEKILTYDNYLLESKKEEEIINLIKKAFDEDGYIIKSEYNKSKAKKLFNSLTNDEIKWLQDLKIDGYSAWDSLVMISNPDKEL